MDLSLRDIGDLIEYISSLDVGKVVIEVGDTRIEVGKSTGRVDPVDIDEIGGAELVTHSRSDSPRTRTEAFVDDKSDRDKREAPRGLVPSESVSKKEEVEHWLASEEKDEVSIIRSPMVGTFYRASEPGARPYVEVGQNVDPGDVVCLVEVMKLYHSITASVGGVVVAVLVDDGSVVEFNQPLIVVSRE